MDSNKHGKVKWARWLLMAGYLFGTRTFTILMMWRVNGPVLPVYGLPLLRWGCLIFIMGIPLLVKWHLNILNRFPGHQQTWYWPGLLGLFQDYEGESLHIWIPLNHDVQPQLLPQGLCLCDHLAVLHDSSSTDHISIDGLVQDSSNSSALALSHQYMYIFHGYRFPRSRNISCRYVAAKHQNWHYMAQ